MLSLKGFASFFVLFFIDLSIILLNMEKIKDYFKCNPNASIWKPAQALKLSKASLHRILKHLLIIDPYKISFHQLLSKRSMAQRFEFCPTMRGIFKEG